MWNTLRINLYSIATFPVPVIFSLMLNELTSNKFKKSVQMITYAPHFVSTVVTVVVCSITVLFLKQDNGLINNLREMLGLERVDYMTKPEFFAPIYAISGLWQNLGWSTIMYLAALSNLQPEIIQAAQIDGASRLQVIRYINIPHLLPII